MTSSNLELSTPDLFATFIFISPKSLNMPSVIASEGFTFAKFFLRLYDLNSECGIKLLVTKYTTTQRKRLKYIRLFIDLNKDIPEDFMAANS